MIHSSSIQDHTTRLFRKYFSVTKWWRIMENWLWWPLKIMDLKNHWIMTWNYRQLRTSNTRKWTKIEIRVPSKTSQRVVKDRFNQLLIKREKNQWDSREWPVEFRTQLNKRLLNKIVAFRSVTITQIMEDHILESLIQLTQVRTRFKVVNRTKAHWWIKRTAQL